MAADTMTEHFSTEFTKSWIERKQQTSSRLDAFIESETVMGERKRYDRVGTRSSRKRTERKGPTIATNSAMDSRWAYHDSYEDAFLLDRDDAVNLAPLALPDSPLIKQSVNAFNRDCDDNAVAVALGAVITGENGTTSTAFGAGQQIAAGGTGLTIAKLIQIQEIFNTADVEPDDPRVIVVGAKQLTNMLNTLEVRSDDYNSVKALVAGKVDTFMGFKFVLNNRLTKVSTTRSCVAWVKGAIKQIRTGVTTDVGKRLDLSLATQIYSYWRIGGVRVHDEAVVQVDCIEA